MIVISSLLIISCSDDNPTDSNPVTGNTMTATVDGASWVAGNPVFNKLFGQLSGYEEVNEAGTNTNVITIQFDVPGGVPETGIHEVIAIYKEVRDGTGKEWQDENGVCNVTSASNNIIEGTFTLNVEPIGNNTEFMKVITGKFKAKVQ